MTRIRQIFALLSILISINCGAQNLVGLNAYYNMTKIGTDSVGFNKKMYSEPGYGFGIAYKHMELRNMIGFQGEVNFQQTSFTIKPQDGEYFTQPLKYVNIPLLMHIDIGQHTVKGLAAIGCYGNFLIDKGKAKTNIESDSSWKMINRISNGEYKTFSYGLTGQAGIAICTKAGVFEIIGRGYIGMSKMIKMKDIALLNYVTERSFGLGVAYYRPFGKGDPYYTKKEKVKKDSEELDKETVPTDPKSTEENTGTEEPVPPSVDEDKKPDIPQDDDQEWEDRLNK